MSAFGQENDLNMVGLLREVWAARAFLVVGLCVGFLIAFGIVAVSVPKFEARMMVGPAQPLETLMQARFDDGQNSYLFGAERGRAGGARGAARGGRGGRRGRGAHAPRAGRGRRGCHARGGGRARRGRRGRATE